MLLEAEFDFRRMTLFRFPETTGASCYLRPLLKFNSSLIISDNWITIALKLGLFFGDASQHWVSNLCNPAGTLFSMSAVVQRNSFRSSAATTWSLVLVENGIAAWWIVSHTETAKLQTSDLVEKSSSRTASAGNHLMEVVCAKGNGD